MTAPGLRRQRRISLGPVDVTVAVPPELADRVRVNSVYRHMVKPAFDRLSRSNGNGHANGNGNGHVDIDLSAVTVPAVVPDPESLDAEGRELIEKVARRQWYHTIDLGHGVVTPGFVDHREQLPYYAIPASLEGLRVLDVATFDGYWAFEFERRGAEVVAADIPRWSDVDVPRLMLKYAKEFGLDRPTGDGFKIADDALNSKVERVECSVYDLDPAKLGTFDIVFISDLLVHFRDPQLALERAFSVCHGEVVVADVYTPQLDGFGDLSLAQFTAPGETWWLPNAEALRAMMVVAGFEPIDEISRFTLQATAEDTIHKVVLRGRAPEQPSWVRMALDYRAATLAQENQAVAPEREALVGATTAAVAATKEQS